MYTYSRFYIIFNRSLKLLSLGTHRFGLPTKDMPLFQTHSRGNCDESSETRIFPSTTNWSVIWSHSFPLRFWKILKFSQASWRQKKTQRLHPCLFRVPTTSSAWCYFLMFFCQFFSRPCSTRSLWWISESLATCPQMLQQVASPQDGRFFGGAWELTWKPAVASYYGFRGRNPKQPTGIYKKTV